MRGIGVPGDNERAGAAWCVLQGQPPLPLQAGVQPLQGGGVHAAVVGVPQGAQLVPQVARVAAAAEALPHDDKLVAPMQHLHDGTPGGSRDAFPHAFAALESSLTVREERSMTTAWW